MKKIMKTAMVIVLLLGCIFLSGCGAKNTINLNDYVNVTISGVNTKGQAEIEVDYENLELEIAKVLGVKVDEDSISSLEDLGNAFADLEKIEKAMNCVEFFAEPAEQLENGDTVIVKADINSEKSKELGVKFSFKEIEEKVEGLQEAVEISQEELFQDIIVEFTGTAPNAEVQIRNTSKDEIISQIYFVTDQTEKLNAGDKIVVTAENAEDFAEDGYLFVEKSKEYTVRNVNAYITDFDQFTETGLQKIMEQAGNMIEAQLVTKSVDTAFHKGDEFIALMNSFEKISEPELQTSYFYSLKEGIDHNYGEVYNALQITYKFDLTKIGGGMFEAEAADYQDCYISIWCVDLILDKNGEVQFDINTMEFSDAYSSVDTFLMKEVDTSMDRYDIQKVELADY